MSSQQTVQPVPTPSKFPPTLVEKPFTIFDPEFLDTGVVVSIDVPNAINFKYLTGMPNAGNLPILFSHQVSDRVNRVFDGATQTFLATSPDFWLEGISTQIHATLCENVNQLRARTFRGWRGDLEYLYTFSANSVLQGQISIIRVRNVPAINVRDMLLDAMASENDSNVLVNLATDRNVIVKVPYNETTPWIDEALWYASTGDDAFRFRTNQFRSYITLRANTPISTFNGQPSKLYIKVFIKYGANFEWLYPTSPVNVRIQGIMGVLDYHDPFAYQIRYVITGWNDNSTLVYLYDSYAHQVVEITSTPHEFSLPASRRWFWANTVLRDYEIVHNFTVQISSSGGVTDLVVVWGSGTHVSLANNLWARGTVLVSFGANYYDDPPEYPIIPPPSRRDDVRAITDKVNVFDFID